MKGFFIAALLSVLPCSRSGPGASCESKAVGNDGKPLTGAAKTSFIKKCKKEMLAYPVVTHTPDM